MQMWVDFEPFCFGVIQAHPKLSKVYLKKVLAYARGKGTDGGYPILSWSVWRHMAINKMLIPERFAWAYFNAYYSIKETSREERLEEAELMQQSFESSDKELYKSKLSVDTLEFVLHLFLQQSSKISLRKSLVGEEWPRASPRSKSPGPDSLESPKMSGIPSIMEENSRLTFLLTHLSDMIELLSEPDSDHQSKSDRRLPIEAVRAFSYIIKPYLPKSDSVVPLHSIATKHRFQSKSGYSRTRNDFSCRVFENWVRSALMPSPYSMNALLESASTLPWAMPTTGRRALAKRWRIMHHSVSGYCRVILFLQCSDQTICQQSSLLRSSSVRFVKCNKSHFYMLSPLRSVSIEKCHNSLFVLGPVMKCVRVTGCNNVTIISPTRSVIIGSSNQVVAHIASPTRPLLIGDNATKYGAQHGAQYSVTLGPYHTHYERLEEHLAEIGLVISPQIDQWNNPMCMIQTLSRSRDYSANNDPTTSEFLDTTEKDKPNYHILPPDDFFTFVIPFQLPDHSYHDSRTVGIPWGLPEMYQKAVKEKQLVVKKYKLAVKGAEMTKAERRKFQSHVEARFKEWLEASGMKRQLDDLVEIDQAKEKTEL